MASDLEYATLGWTGHHGLVMQGCSRAGGALILGLVNEDEGAGVGRDSEYSRR